jgi:phosphoadenosine phosphosulfate reductase
MPPDLLSAAEDDRALKDLNDWLGARDAQERTAWALATLPGEHALSSSFGVQSAAVLHLATSQRRDIPVVLVDTGYLFAETYRFVDDLVERLDLNLKVYRPKIGVAWMEARFGRLWEKGVEGIDQYNRMRKVEPMQRALTELGARTWIAGLRRSQSSTRKAIDFLELNEGRWKLHPIADWSEQDVSAYLQKHELPRHPLWNSGYVSIGDTHTTQRWEPGMLEEDTRFFGLKRECGLHFG